MSVFCVCLKATNVINCASVGDPVNLGAVDEEYTGGLPTRFVKSHLTVRKFTYVVYCFFFILVRCK